jgi:FKBP-type peptidyl-prolyl cis-trans isomerase 2
MKENLVESLDVILKALEANKIQNIEVRGAIAFGKQFESALAVVPSEDIDCLEKETKEEISKEEKKLEK